MELQELRKALLATTGDGGNLVPEDLESLLVEYLGREMPLWNFIPKGQANGK